MASAPTETAEPGARLPAHERERDRTQARRDRDAAHAAHGPVLKAQLDRRF